ncbi:MAG TPA: cytochrome c [Vicinamibacteria bacterium]|jgi:disulfide bond formation protein DsbB
MKSFTLAMMVCITFALAACGGNQGEAESAPPEAALLVGNVSAGEKVFGGTCFTCHGDDATGIEGSGTNLTISEFIRSKTDAELIEYIKVGREINDPLNTTGIAMPPYGADPMLTDQDLADVVAYLRSLQQGS